MDEVRILLRRAAAGEFKLSPEELAACGPADLIRQVDQIIRRLSERERATLMLRFGASGEEPLGSRQIGRRQRVTPKAVWARISHTLEWMRRDGSLKLRALLERVDSVGAGKQPPLTAALVSTWQDPARPFQHSQEFYARLIPRLRPEPESREGE